MDVLLIGEREYMKVSSAARETGYTTDYIGQLCRAKKIDAKLVGRTWYVLADEVHAHRRTRGRSSKEKTRQALQTELAREGGENASAARERLPEYRKHLLGHKISYTSDSHELAPRPAQGHVTVISEDTEESIDTIGEHNLKIESQEDTEKVSFTKAEKPEVKWNGTIVVSSLPETEAEESAEDAYREDGSSNSKKTGSRIEVIEEDKSEKVPMRQGYSDSLSESKERFLSRISAEHEGAPEARPAARLYPARDHFVDKKAVPAHREILPSLYVSKLPALLGTVSVAALFLFANIFIETEIVFVKGSEVKGEGPSVTSTYSVSTLKNVQNNMANSISAIRDMAY